MKASSNPIIIIIFILAIGGFAYIYSTGGIPSSFQFESGTPLILYNNEIIKISNKFISDNSPFSGQSSNIEFVLTNVGNAGTIKGVNIELNPTTGFNSDITCNNLSCSNLEILEGEDVNVIISLTALTREEGITQITPVDVRYSISFPYIGEREASIPILNNRNTLPQGQKFSLGHQSNGPIGVNIIPPSPRSTGDTTEIFAINEIPIKITYSFNNLGNSFGGVINPITFKENQINIITSNLEYIFCDKLNDSGTIKEDINKIDIPFQIICTYEPKSVDDFTLGNIKVKYEYNYKISFTDKFIINPKEATEIGINSNIVNSNIENSNIVNSENEIEEILQSDLEFPNSINDSEISPHTRQRNNF